MEGLSPSLRVIHMRRAILVLVAFKVVNLDCGISHSLWKPLRGLKSQYVQVLFDETNQQYNRSYGAEIISCIVRNILECIGKHSLL